MSVTPFDPQTHVSAHLTWRELACHDTLHTPYPLDFRTDGRVQRLAAVFETLRLLWGGRPVHVLSAYRTHVYNHHIGGAPDSQHIHGRALDLEPPAGLTMQAAFCLAHTLATTQLHDLRGLGLYRGFLHVDIRPSTEIVMWQETVKGLARLTPIDVEMMKAA